MRALLNRWRRWLWRQLFYRMVFGEQGRAGQALPHTRIAPSTCIEGEAGLELADHVVILGPGVIAAQGTPDEVRASSDPLVHQYVNALPTGPVPFHYPGVDIAQDFGAQDGGLQ